MANDTFPLIDRLLGGELAPIIIGLRAEGISAEQIAFRLQADHEVTVAGETVRRWLVRLTASTPAMARKQLAALNRKNAATA